MSVEVRFADFQPVVFVVGLLTIGEALVVAVFAFGEWAAGGANVAAFGEAAVLTLFFGGLFTFSMRTDLSNLSARQGFVLTTLAWIVVPAIGALPLYFSVLQISYTDALFEAVSAMTTTGSTVLSGLDNMDRGILLWRALLQWLGGIGIIVTAIAVLPILRVGGMQLFQAESSDRSEKLLPRASQVARSIFFVYVGLTIACAIAYGIAGMSGFDAIAHAMTTIPTAGFSTRDASLGAFEAGAQWVAIVFMLSGAIPFVLYVRAARGGLSGFVASGQIRLLLALVVLASILLVVWLTGRSDMAFSDALRHATFNVVSVITTTGFASTDYGAWGGFAVSLFLLLTVLGGCTGSTAGGIKMFRLIVIYRTFQVQIARVISPHIVVLPTYDGQPVPDDIPPAVLSFAFLYFLIIVVLALALSELGLGPLTAISSAATAIANVGPGLGQTVGPAGNFASLSDAAKWLMCFAMLLGRLELFTILVLVTPRFWRN